MKVAESIAPNCQVFAGCEIELFQAWHAEKSSRQVSIDCFLVEHGQFNQVGQSTQGHFTLQSTDCQLRQLSKTGKGTQLWVVIRMPGVAETKRSQRMHQTNGIKHARPDNRVHPHNVQLGESLHVLQHICQPRTTSSAQQERA